MIVTRGLGRGPTLGAIVAFGLTREVVGGTPATSSGGGKARRKYYFVNKFDPFNELRNFLFTNDLLLPQTVVDLGHETVATADAVLTAPITIVDDKPVTYNPLFEMMNQLTKVTKKEVSGSLEKQLLAIVAKAKAAVRREEEEVLMLIEMEIL